MTLLSKTLKLPCYSVRRNICYGLEEEDGIAAEDQPSQEQIEEAAKLANAHDFICALPRGYDMVFIGTTQWLDVNIAGKDHGHTKSLRMYASDWRGPFQGFHSIRR